MQVKFKSCERFYLKKNKKEKIDKLQKLNRKFSSTNHKYMLIN